MVVRRSFVCPSFWTWPRGPQPALSIPCLTRTLEYETNDFFEGLDRNGNRMLSRTEFIQGWFGIFDTNRNKSLSRDEFRNSIESLSVEL
ncbi:MAG: hypothetical protein ACRENP_15410 [Longimicrobiales bacterium]